MIAAALLKGDRLEVAGVTCEVVRNRQSGNWMELVYVIADVASVDDAGHGTMWLPALAQVTAMPMPDQSAEACADRAEVIRIDRLAKGDDSDDVDMLDHGYAS